MSSRMDISISRSDKFTTFKKTNGRRAYRLKNEWIETCRDTGALHFFTCWQGLKRDLPQTITIPSRAWGWIERCGRNQERHDDASLAAHKKAQDIMKGDPELAAALAVSHPIILDIAEKLNRFGSISSPQRNLVIKLAREKSAPKAPEVYWPLSEGRQELYGEVVLKRTEGTFDEEKTIVQTFCGNRVWVNQSASTMPWQEGDLVTFRATIVPGRRSKTYFAKRPHSTNYVHRDDPMHNALKKIALDNQKARIEEDTIQERLAKKQRQQTEAAEVARKAKAAKMEAIAAAKQAAEHTKAQKANRWAGLQLPKTDSVVF